MLIPRYTLAKGKSGGMHCSRHCPRRRSRSNPKKGLLPSPPRSSFLSFPWHAQAQPSPPHARRQEYCRVVTAGGRMALSLDRAVELYESRRYASMACGRCPWPTKTHEYAPCTQVEPLVGHTTHNAQADEGRVEPDEGQRGDLRLVKQLWERCTLIMNPRGLYDRITSVARAFTRMGESNGGGPWWGNPPGAPRS